VKHGYQREGLVSAIASEEYQVSYITGKIVLKRISFGKLFGKNYEKGWSCELYSWGYFCREDQKLLPALAI
jgi:hypothetical protein